MFNSRELFPITTCCLHFLHSRLEDSLRACSLAVSRSSEVVPDSCCLFVSSQSDTKNSPVPCLCSHVQPIIQILVKHKEVTNYSTL